LSAIEKFAFFQRFLAPPTPVASYQSKNVWFCVQYLDHQWTPTVLEHRVRALSHAEIDDGNSTVAALRNRNANLFSDLLLHNMGPGLADNILQGQAQGDEFRSAPLWGLGSASSSSTTAEQTTCSWRSGTQERRGPEVRSVRSERGHQQLQPAQRGKKQDVLNFLRSL